jgi:hypothetical protein
LFGSLVIIHLAMSGKTSPPHVALDVASQFPRQCGCIDPR